MHGRDVVAGLDALCGEPLHHGLAVEPAVELDDVDEPRALVVRVVRVRRLDAVDVSEQLRVPGSRRTAELEDPVELLQL